MTKIKTPDSPTHARAHYKRIPDHEWNDVPVPPVSRPQPAPVVKNFYHAPKKVKAPELPDESVLADDGTTVVIWASVLRDLSALFLEGVSLVILGHVISMVAIVMLAGIFIGIFTVRQKARHDRRKRKS